MAYTFNAKQGKLFVQIYRVLAGLTLIFTGIHIISSLFVSRYAIISRASWEWLSPLIGALGLISVLLYYLLIWFYSPARPLWERILLIFLFFNLYLFHPLAKG